jgi:hypothetical protein
MTDCFQRPSVSLFNHLGLLRSHLWGKLLSPPLSLVTGNIPTVDACGRGAGPGGVLLVGDGVGMLWLLLPAV